MRSGVKRIDARRCCVEYVNRVCLSFDLLVVVKHRIGEGDSVFLGKEVSFAPGPKDCKESLEPKRPESCLKKPTHHAALAPNVGIGKKNCFFCHAKHFRYNNVGPWYVMKYTKLTHDIERFGRECQFCSVAVDEARAFDALPIPYFTKLRDRLDTNYVN